MKPLFVCKACGFISTLGSEYSLKNGVRFDKGCLEKFDKGLEPVRTWVAEALEAGAVRKN